MKLRRLGVQVMAVGLFLGGCAHRREEPKPEVSPEEAARVQRQDTAGKTATDLQSFNASRAAYAQNVEKTLNELSAKTAVLKTKLPSDPAKRESESQAIADVQAKLDQASAKLEDLKSSSSDEWSQQQAAMEEAIAGVQNQYNQVSTAMTAH